MKLEDILVPVTGDNAKQLREGDLLYTPTREQLEMDVAECILDEIRSVRVAVSSISGNLGVVYEEGLHGAHSTELTLLRERHGVYRKLLPGENKVKLESDSFKTALEHYLRARQPSKPKGAEVPGQKSRLETFVRGKIRLGNTSFNANSGEGTFYIESKTQEDAEQASYDLRTIILQECGEEAYYVDENDYHEIKTSRREILALLAKFCQNLNVVGPERNRVSDFNGFAQKNAKRILCRIKRPAAQGGMHFVDVQFKYSA